MKPDDVLHDEALAAAAAATVRLVLAIRAWEDSLDDLAAATRRRKAEHLVNIGPGALGNVRPAEQT